MSQQYLQYKIQISQPETTEMLIALLSNWGIEGFEENEETLTGCGLKANVDENLIDIFLAEQAVQFEKNIVEQQNWNAAWESSFNPVIVDDFAAIRAHFHVPVPNVLHEIIITPKMSFGTGHHATTFMMMQQMRDLNFEDKLVFDFGTGTGILAILAEKMGATLIEAIDNDEWCIENGLENITRNKCKSIDIFKAETIETNKIFDIILANINKNIILENLEKLIQVTKNEGFILLSGLLIADEFDIQKAAELLNLTKVKLLEKSGWISILYKK